MPSSGSATSSIEELARFAEQLAAAARGETLSRLATAVAVENKGGGSSFDPVTEADRDRWRIDDALDALRAALPPVLEELSRA